MASNWERWAPLSGILAVILWIIGFLIIGETKDKPAEILQQIRDDDVRIIIGSIIFWIGTGLFIWLLGTLRTRLLAAEGPTGRVTAVAYGAGVGLAVCLMLLPAALAAAAINKEDLDASAASAMSNMSDAFFLGAEYMFPWLLFAFALVSIRYRAFPKWLGWLSVLIGIGLLTGWIGWAFLILGLPVWTLIVSILLWRDGDRVAMAPPAAGATG